MSKKCRIVYFEKGGHDNNHEGYALEIEKDNSWAMQCSFWCIVPSSAENILWQLNRLINSGYVFIGVIRASDLEDWEYGL